MLKKSVLLFLLSLSSQPILYIWRTRPVKFLQPQDNLPGTIIHLADFPIKFTIHERGTLSTQLLCQLQPAQLTEISPLDVAEARNGAVPVALQGGDGHLRLVEPRDQRVKDGALLRDERLQDVGVLALLMHQLARAPETVLHLAVVVVDLLHVVHRGVASVVLVQPRAEYAAVVEVCVVGRAFRRSRLLGGGAVGLWHDLVLAGRQSHVLYVVEVFEGGDVPV